MGDIDFHVDQANLCIGRADPNRGLFLRAQVHATLALVEAVKGVSVNLDYICTELQRQRGAA